MLTNTINYIRQLCPYFVWQPIVKIMAIYLFSKYGYLSALEIFNKLSNQLYGSVYSQDPAVERQVITL